jgi:hypothetical protein
MKTKNLIVVGLLVSALLLRADEPIMLGTKDHKVVSPTTIDFSSALVLGLPISPSALTETNDTNVTLALSGTPATSLLAPVTITAGWTGTLATSRGGLGSSIAPSVGQQVRGVPGSIFGAFTTAITTANPANPVNTTSTAGVMAGLKVAFTPKYSGNELVIVTGRAMTSALNSYGTIQVYYGTGTAPNNGAAITGTAVGNPIISSNIQAANDVMPFTGVVVAMNLTIGTVYWFDLSQMSNMGGTTTFNLYSISMNLIEL